jgi:hypothetical protein
MLSLPPDLHTTLSGRNSLSRSSLVAHQVGRLELLEACLHVVGVVVIVGRNVSSPHTIRVRADSTYLLQITSPPTMSGG